MLLQINMSKWDQSFKVDLHHRHPLITKRDTINMEDKEDKDLILTETLKKNTDA